MLKKGEVLFWQCHTEVIMSPLREVEMSPLRYTDDVDSSSNIIYGIHHYDPQRAQPILYSSPTGTKRTDQCPCCRAAAPVPSPCETSQETPTRVWDIRSHP